MDKNPTILIIFGATGDLMEKKLVPALYELFRKNALPKLFQVIGFSRRDLTEEAFRDLVKSFLPVKHRADSEKFLKLFTYKQGFFNKKNDYIKLGEYLGMTDNEWRVCSNKLFYLAVPPQYYQKIFDNLYTTGLTKPCSPEEGWTRVIVEKPFGRDLRTAEALDAKLGKLFKEEQIYRIDHYLGKDTVQNILAFRFSNSFLEPAWNHNAIESIHIKFWEKAGVEGREEFYDGVGALRDVGQNHLLQLLALLTMENPGGFEGEIIRKKRAELLSAIHILSAKETREHTARGQYEGYRNLKGVKQNSETETYFHIRTSINTPRWSGMPVILEGGKKMSEDKVEIVITFRHLTPCLCPKGVHYKNTLHYEIKPRERISTSFWVKKPGSEMKIEEKDFSFDYKSAYPEGDFTSEYEKLLLHVIRGDQTLFVSTEEIVASWKFIDPILRTWKTKQPPLEFYAPGSIIKEVPVLTDGKREVAFIGLGKMGLNMVTRLIERGWTIYAYDKNEKAVAEAVSRGAKPLSELADIANVKHPRVVWTMVPAGAPVDDLLFGENGLAKILEKGDIVVDGGNSFFEDSERRFKRLKKLGVHFMDAGVSGGPGGARNGACIMVGGEKKIFSELEPLFRDLSLPDGYRYFGRTGAGHFVKMVHNGIEYGMMQAIAEGFEVMKKSSFELNLEDIADLYNHGSVVESRLIGWLRNAFKEYGENLGGISGTVGHTGEGEWTIKTAKKMKISIPVIKDSFKFRIRSDTYPSFAGQVLSALRNQFGGHSVAKIKKPSPKRARK